MLELPSSEINEQIPGRLFMFPHLFWVSNKGFDDMDSIHASPEDFQSMKHMDKIKRTSLAGVLCRKLPSTWSNGNWLKILINNLFFSPLQHIWAWDVADHQLDSIGGSNTEVLYFFFFFPIIWLLEVVDRDPSKGTILALVHIYYLLWSIFQITIIPAILLTLLALCSVPNIW